MKDYDNWVSRLFSVKEERDENGDCKPIDKEGVTSNGIPFNLSIGNDWGKETAILNLEFKDCAEFKAKSLVHIVGRGGINLYHTLDYIMHCESNASAGQQRYKEYETAFDVARSLLEEFFSKGYDTYRVYINDEQKCKVTVCSADHEVAITIDLGSKEVAVEFTPKYEGRNVYIAYPMDMMISYSEVIDALKKDYYGECGSCDEDEEDEEKDEEE